MVSIGEHKVASVEVRAPKLPAPSSRPNELGEPQYRRSGTSNMEETGVVVKQDWIMYRGAS